jgi:ketosteroid isomerase-like protein
MPEAELVLRSAYRAFNARDIEAAIELMHPEVDWPNAWEGGRVVGRAAVRDYWDRQFAAISSEVEPEGFTEEADGSITVDVHQVVHDASTGELISDSRVRHRYRLEDGLVVRMDVLEAPDQQ